MSYCKNIHDSVKINSNFSFPDFSEGEVSDPDIIVEVKKDFDFSTKGLSRLDFWFYGKDGGNFVYFEDNFLGMTNKVLLKNLYKHYRGTELKRFSVFWWDMNEGC